MAKWFVTKQNEKYEAWTINDQQKFNLTWYSCEDNPPEKDGFYILCYGNNCNDYLNWDRAYYKKQDNAWIDPGTDCVYGFKDEYSGFYCIPCMWTEVILPIN